MKRKTAITVTVALVCFWLPATANASRAAAGQADIAVAQNPMLAAVQAILLTTSPRISYVRSGRPTINEQLIVQRVDGSLMDITPQTASDHFQASGNGAYIGWWDPYASSDVTVLNLVNNLQSSYVLDVNDAPKGIGADGSLYAERYFASPFPHYEVWRYSPSGSVAFVTPSGTALSYLAIDGTHLALGYSTYTVPGQVHIVDLATGVDTYLADHVSLWGGLRLNGPVVSWATGTFPRYLSFALRSGGAVTTVDVAQFAGFASVGTVVTDGTWVMWDVCCYGQFNKSRASIARLDGSVPRLDVPLNLIGGPVLGDNGHFSMPGQATTGETGIFDVAQSGATVLLAPVEPGPAVIRGVAATNGRLRVLDTRVPGGGLTESRIARVPAGLFAEPLRKFGPEPIDLGVNARLVASGPYSAITDGKVPGTLTIFKDGVAIRTITSTADMYVLALSGTHLLYANSSAGTSGGTYLLDVVSNFSVKQPSGLLALSGQWLYNAPPASPGTIVATDLSTGAVRTVRQPGGCSIYYLSAWNELVNYLCIVSRNDVPFVLDTSTGINRQYPPQVGYTNMIGDHVFIGTDLSSPARGYAVYDSATGAKLRDIPTASSLYTGVDDSGRFAFWVENDVVTVHQLVADTTPETFVSHFPANLGADITAAANYYGVPSNALGSVGAAAISFISHLPGVNLQAMPPAQNSGPVTLTSSLALTDVEIIEDAAQQLGQTSDEMHVIGAYFLVYLWTIMGSP